MINEIKDHFILVDKCAEQTRIVEIKSNKITIKDLDLGRNFSEKTSSREEWKENKNQKTIEFSELINFFRN